MSGQRFETLNQVRLDVEAEPDPATLQNRIANPNGELGGWGWITPVANTTVSKDTAQSGLLRFVTTAAQPAYFLSELTPMAAGQYAGARLLFYGTGAGFTLGWLRGRLVFVNAAGAVISSGPQTAYTAAGNVLQVSGAQAPAGTAYVQLRLDMYGTNTGANPGANAFVTFTDATLAVSASSAQLGSQRTNLFPSPSFEQSGAYISGEPSTIADRRGAADGIAAYLGTYVAAFHRVTSTGTAGLALLCGNNYAGTLIVEPGRNYAIQLRIKAKAATARNANVYVNGYLPGGSGVMLNQLVATKAGLEVTDGYVLLSAVWTCPSNIGLINLSVRVPNATAWGAAGDLGEEWYVDAVMIEQADAVAGYFAGDTPDAGGVDYAWTGAAGASPSTATIAGQLPFIPPITWLSILGTATQLTIDRAPLDTGLLEGVISDSALDPAQSDVLQPGRRMRLLSVVTPTDEPLYTGTLRRAAATYDLKAKIGKQARITITAANHAAELANVPRSQGVATIAELPHVLEGAGIPWNVNGSGDQVPGAVVVATNDQASALDQIVLTRDSSLGHAWIDRRNVVQAWDETAISATPAATLTEADYTDLQADYDTDRCINTVTIKFLRTGAVGETEEVTYGPYVDDESVAAYGARAATFSIQWLDEDPAAIASFAAAILAANATPTIRVNSVSLPIRDDADFTADAGQRRALLDLLDLVTVQNTARGLDEQLRVQRIQHTITARRWTVLLEFSRDGQVATPLFTPSPSGGAGGKTLGELLAPIGFLHLFYGTPAQIPAGWLEANGAAYDVGLYPKLREHLAIANPALPVGALPDWNDRFIVGASAAKPLASVGGAASVQTPAHTHTIPGQPAGLSTFTVQTGSGTGLVPRMAAFEGHNHGGETGSIPGVNPTIATMPPWRAARVLIRAV